MQILIFELKKIFARKSTIVSIIVLMIWLVYIWISCVSDVNYVEPDGNNIYGIKAISSLKNEKMKWNGALTVSTIKRVIEKNQTINNDPQYKNLTDQNVTLSNMQYAEKQEFIDIRDIINMDYGEFRSFDYYLIDSLTPDVADQFYSNRIRQLETWLDSNEAISLNHQEKQYLLNSAKTLPTPFKYSYADGWQMAFEYSSMLSYALIFAISVIMAPVFSTDIQCGTAAIVLTTEHGRKRGITYRLAAGILSIAGLYWGLTLLFYSILFLLFGVEGYDSPIQAYASGFKSFYHVTNIQALSIIVLLGFIACLFIGCLAMFMSAKSKSSFATIIFLILILFIPSTFSKNIDIRSIVFKIIALFPGQLLNGWFILRTFSFHTFFNRVFIPIHTLPTIYGSLTIILLPLTYQVIRKHQIK